MKMLGIKDLALRYHCTEQTVREDVVRRPGFPRPIMPTGSVRLRLWRECEVEKWEIGKGRRAA